MENDFHEKLAGARRNLHVKHCPDVLPCRDDEYSYLYDALQEAINEKKGTCLYISGVPGSGKTATVSSVISALKESSDTISFDYYQINANKLSTPQHALTALHTHLTKRAASASDPNISSKIEHELNKLRRPAVVLIDELDQLLGQNNNKRSIGQKVIYNFFEWPCRRDSRLIVIAIANTMDLPERVLLNKTNSRLGLTRQNFRPYTHNQLEEIVASRLGQLDVFSKDGITMAARKVASVSGDARKALDICRRSIEILQNSSDELTKDSRVTVEIVEQAVKELNTNLTLKLAKASLHQKIFLAALVKRTRITGLSEDEFYNVVAEHTALAKYCRVESASIGELYQICSQLFAYRWVLIDPSKRRDARQTVRLNIDEQDVIQVLLNDDCKSLRKIFN